MTTKSLETPVGTWAAHNPQAIRIFEQHGIDYCCGGSKTLVAACRAADVDADQILKALQQAPQPDFDESPSVDWTVAPLTQLCDHIETTHHEFLRSHLPYVEQLIGKVVAAHGKAHPELRDLQVAFSNLKAELEPHMMKEEHVLFPAVRRLEEPYPPETFSFGSVQNPIKVMEHEHDNAGRGLRRLRELTDGYAVPDDACPTYRAMMEGLQKLEVDLHVHIHKENNILFPRAALLE